ncbi:hypothetical protein L0337_28590 [candidate division KSB1 bacterium]|nr:hypothetical protein [candidate division KSB1 bacterium]
MPKARAQIDFDGIMRFPTYALLFALGLSLALLSCAKPEEWDVAAVRKAIG